MTRCQTTLIEARDENGNTILEVIQDILQVRRCGLTREEVAQVTNTNYSQAVRILNGDSPVHLEWIAVLGRYVAETYGDFRIVRWIASYVFPPEVYELVADLKDSK